MKHVSGDVCVWSQAKGESATAYVLYVSHALLRFKKELKKRKIPLDDYTVSGD